MACFPLCARAKSKPKHKTEVVCPQVQTEGGAEARVTGTKTTNCLLERATRYMQQLHGKQGQSACNKKKKKG